MELFSIMKSGRSAPDRNGKQYSFIGMIKRSGIVQIFLAFLSIGI